MLKPLLFLFCSLIPFPHAIGDFTVDVRLLVVERNQEIKLEATVRNISDRDVQVPISRSKDYKRARIKALGNYVIEIQKLDGSRYTLIEPTSDITPTFEREDTVVFKKHDQIKDTITINGYSFREGTANDGGFPAGKYRLRVSFSINGWQVNERFPSEWIELEMK